MSNCHVYIQCEEECCPLYASKGASGADLRAYIQQSISLNPLERVLVPTGIRLNMPEGVEAQIRPRSGLAFNYGVTVLNTPGTIDQDYRGDIKVLLINLGSEVFVIQPKMRIAQIIFTQTFQATFELASDLTVTERGQGGFGHTGVH